MIGSGTWMSNGALAQVSLLTCLVNVETKLQTSMNILPSLTSSCHEPKWGQYPPSGSIYKLSKVANTPIQIVGQTCSFLMS